jgi:predicted membrane chloride channel (bestrophin family)
MVSSVDEIICFDFQKKIRLAHDLLKIFHVETAEVLTSPHSRTLEESSSFLCFHWSIAISTTCPITAFDIIFDCSQEVNKLSSINNIKIHSFYLSSFRATTLSFRKQNHCETLDKMKFHHALYCLQVITWMGLCSSFVPHSTTSPCFYNTKITTKLSTASLSMLIPRRNYEDLQWKKPSDEQVENWLQQYGEVSRYYRQDVFDAGDWVRARRPARFVGNIISTWKSGLIRQISLYISVLALCSAGIVVYNNLYFGPKGLPLGLQRWLPALVIPVLPFNLAAGSLGLLLTFRTNVCYQRWNEARSAWGKIINDSRSLARMGCIWGQSYSKKVSPTLLKRLGEAVCSFSRTVMNRTLPRPEDESTFVRYCQHRLSDEVYASNLYNSDHRPTRALAEISAILVQMDLNPLHQIEIEKMVTELCSALGVCERILTSPVPTFYSRHTSRFLAFWLFFLPMALYDTITGWNHFAMVPVMMTMGGFLLGIEELSCQLVSQ